MHGMAGRSKRPNRGGGGGGGAGVRYWTRPLISKSTKCGGVSEMRRKIKALQELVPNGRSMGLDGLFREAANYIVGLQVQVKVMQMLLRQLPPLSPEEVSGQNCLN